MLRSSRFVASFATALAVGGAAIVPATPALAADSPIYRTILQPGEDESVSYTHLTLPTILLV